MGDSKKSVPDSCCLFEAPGCGQNLFEITDIRVIVQKINIHGCLFVMKKRLDTHVTIILMIFAGCGSILGENEWIRVKNIKFCYILLHLGNLFSFQQLLSCSQLCWHAAYQTHSLMKLMMTWKMLITLLFTTV